METNIIGVIFIFFLSLQYENVVKDHKKNQKINKLDKY